MPGNLPTWRVVDLAFLRDWRAISTDRERMYEEQTHGPPQSAPIMVPIEKRPTMAPERALAKVQLPGSVGSAQVANRRRKSSMSRMSEIWPVSY
jgi:hypothetical protein